MRFRGDTLAPFSSSARLYISLKKKQTINSSENYWCRPRCRLCWRFFKSSWWCYNNILHSIEYSLRKSSVSMLICRKEQIIKTFYLWVWRAWMMTKLNRRWRRRQLPPVQCMVSTFDKQKLGMSSIWKSNLPDQLERNFFRTTTVESVLLWFNLVNVDSKLENKKMMAHTHECYTRCRPTTNHGLST